MAGVITGSISRTMLSLSALTIGSSGSSTYQTLNLTPSGVQWDRVTATSPWTHGRTLRAARKRSAELTGSIVVVTPLATDPSVHEANVSALVEALSQFAYTLTLTITDGSNTQTWEYACEPADVAPAESIEEYATFRFTTVDVTIPHHPVPDSGAW